METVYMRADSFNGAEILRCGGTSFEYATFGRQRVARGRGSSCGHCFVYEINVYLMIA